MPPSEPAAGSPEDARAWLHGLLAETVRKSASDLFLKTGAPPSMRIDGEVNFLRGDAVPAAVMDGVAGAVLGERAEAARARPTWPTRSTAWGDSD